MRPIRVLIAEDSALFVKVLRSALDAEPDMDVVGVAETGLQAVQLVDEVEPDIILMDIRMPELDGLSATEAIMADRPTPILVVTADPYHGGVDMSFKALSAGALDLVAKPSSIPWSDVEREALLRKVRLLAQIPVVRHQRATGRRRLQLSTPVAGIAPASAELAVGIVASTGGPRALASILAELPGEFPAPVFVVQHIIPGFSAHLARWLDSNTALSVVEAKARTRAEPGTVYLAPAGRHLFLEEGLVMRLSSEEPVAGHRPSGNVLLESLARTSADRTVAVVLSGMGSDGTTGLAAVHRTGGVTLVQDRDSSVVYGMPQSAIDIGVVQDVVDLAELPRRILRDVEAIQRGEP